MPQSPAALPHCWILDRATLKWQRKTYTIVGIMDLTSRKLLGWDVFRPLKADAVANLLSQAIGDYDKPPALVVGVDPMFKTPELTTAYEQHNCLPVDLRQGKSSVTIFIRSLWRNLIYEGLSLNTPPTEEVFRQTINDWLNYYNGKRLHQALAYQTPDKRWHHSVSGTQPVELTLPSESLRQDKVLQLKITLLGVEPPIWRRVLVSELCTFEQLHETLQVAMGWTNSHLHEFRVNNERIGPCFEDMLMEYNEEPLDETGILLKQKITPTDSGFHYLYDFGDSWEHQVQIEQWLLAEPGMSYPVSLDGARHCPPEDCGGVWGYAELLTVLNDKGHPERAETLVWLGGRFKPESFDLDRINQQLAKLDKRRRLLREH